VSSESLHVDRVGRILRLTIDRQARMNALDLDTMRGIGEVIGAVGADRSVRVVVLTGAGKAFCTGADLAAGAAGGGTEAAPDVVMDTANAMIRAVIDAPVPVIARINGPAAGVGTSLALAADLIYADDSTYLLLPFTNIGLLPDGGATAMVAAAMGRVRAAEMALLGERLPTTEAAAAGLITAALPAAELDDRIDAATAKLARGPRRALELTKKAITAATLGGLDAAMQREKVGQIELLGSPDFAEGIVAMLTRREPKFGTD
jgi:enoyl-CoA hydratase